MDLGVDVSKYQNLDETIKIQMNFEKAKAEDIRFAYIKASQALYSDPDFAQNRVNVKKASLPYGFYHFLVFDISGKAQANFYWNLIKDDKGQLPMVVDFEGRKKVVTPPNAKHILVDFLEELKRLSGNAPIIIYTGMFFWKDFSDKNPYWTQYGLWGASYSSQKYFEKNMREFTPWEEWLIWQYTDKGDGRKYGAESAQIDLNYLNGSIDSFLAELAPQATVDELQELVTALNNRLTAEVAERHELYKLMDSVATDLKAVALKLESYKN